METTIIKSEISKRKKASMPKSPIESSRVLDTKQRYIFCRKDNQDPTAMLIEELLIKCNEKSVGATIDFSRLLSYAIKLIKDSDIVEIQNSSLSDEDRARAEVLKFNTKHGTNYTMFEFVLNGLQKKSKKGVEL